MRITQTRWLFLVFVFATMTGFGCREKTIEPKDTEDILTAEDVGVTDVWLKIRLPYSRIHQPITLKRDSTTILNTTLTTIDTLVADEQLLPHHTYIYTLIQNLGLGIKPETQLTVTTMDTTSHNFTWEIDTLGDGNSSVLNDVAIINDTCAWAVGEIYYKDSTGQFGKMYNAANWDGSKWNPHRISVKLTYSSSYIITDQDPMKTVFSVSENDIWFVSSSGGVSRYHTNSWEMMNIPYNEGPGGGNKIWGTSSNDLYFVANNGKIVHYNGTCWEKMESGTTLSLVDVYGTSEQELYASGVRYSNEQGIILKYIAGQWTKVIDSYLDGFDETQLFKTQLFGPIDGIWVDNSGTLYAVGELLFKYSHGQWGYASGLPENNIYARKTLWSYMTAIRGINKNDIVVVGQSKTIRHYNGISWEQIGPPFEEGSRFNLYGVAMNGCMIVAAGEIEDGRAAIIQLKRN